jgi:hypothetical protein
MLEVEELWNTGTSASESGSCTESETYWIRLQEEEAMREMKREPKLMKLK